MRLAVFLHSGLKTSDIVKVHCIILVCLRRIRSKLDGAPVVLARFFPLTLILTVKSACQTMRFSVMLIGGQRVLQRYSGFRA